MQWLFVKLADLLHQNRSAFPVQRQKLLSADDVRHKDNTTCELWRHFITFMRREVVHIHRLGTRAQVRTSADFIHCLCEVWSVLWLVATADLSRSLASA